MDGDNKGREERTFEKGAEGLKVCRSVVSTRHKDNNRPRGTWREVRYSWSEKLRIIVESNTNEGLEG